MAQKARIIVQAYNVPFTRRDWVEPGITIKMNISSGGTPVYRSFISTDEPGDPLTDFVHFNTLERLGRNIANLGPYYFTVEDYSTEIDGELVRTYFLKVDALYHGDNYDFGAFYSSKPSSIDSPFQLNNINPESTLKITSMDITPAREGESDGTVRIYATSNARVIEYSIDGINYSTATQGGFSGLAAGDYTAYVRDDFGGQDAKPFIVGAYVPQMNVQFTKKDVTVFSGNDGEITLFPNPSNWDYTYLWDDGVTTKDRTGLGAGEYTVVITAVGRGQEQELLITINEPFGVPKETSELFVPDLNSIRFVREELIDNLTVFKNPENTLFADNEQPGITHKGYCQKVTQSDIITVQLQSNYDLNTLIVRNIKTGEEVLRTPFLLKIQLSEIEENYTGTADFAYFSGPAVGSTPTTYIYPNAVTFESQDIVVISGSVDFDGAYNILSRGVNPLNGREYVEINKEIAINENNNPDRQVDITFLNDLRPYNIFEASINFGLFPVGYYQATIESSDPQLITKKLVSEPIHLKESHEGTVMVEYQNEDNAFNIAYSTNILNRIRVEGRFFKSVPQGDSEVHRQPSGDIVKTSGKAYRGRLLETYKLPTWLHEKLFVIFQHDHILINKQECQTEELYEFEYTDYNPLASGQIAVEVLGWFDKGNGHDPGNGLTESGFIIANGGFIKR